MAVIVGNSSSGSTGRAHPRQGNFHTFAFLTWFKNLALSCNNAFASSCSAINCNCCSIKLVSHAAVDLIARLKQRFSLARYKMCENTTSL